MADTERWHVPVPACESIALSSVRADVVQLNLAPEGQEGDSEELIKTKAVEKGVLAVPGVVSTPFLWPTKLTLRRDSCRLVTRLHVCGLVSA